MKVVLLPMQIVVCGVLTETVGVTFGKTVMVTAFDVASGFKTHDREDVMSTVITSLFEKEVDE